MQPGSWFTIPEYEKGAKFTAPVPETDETKAMGRGTYAEMKKWYFDFNDDGSSDKTSDMENFGLCFSPGRHFGAKLCWSRRANWRRIFIIVIAAVAPTASPAANATPSRRESSGIDFLEWFRSCTGTKHRNKLSKTNGISSSEAAKNKEMRRRALMPKQLPKATGMAMRAGPRETKKIVVAIEANIGAGKSTILRSLEREFAGSEKVGIIDEPVEDWINSGALGALYEKRVSGSLFQMGVLATRTAKLLHGLATTKQVLISERWDLGDQAFADVVIQNPDDRRVYDMSMKALGDYVTKQADIVYIFLDVPPEVCLDRIQSRRRPDEQHIDLAYLINIDRAHRNLIAPGHDKRILVVDGNRDKATVFNDVRAIIYSLLDSDKENHLLSQKKKKSYHPQCPNNNHGENTPWSNNN